MSVSKESIRLKFRNSIYLPLTRKWRRKKIKFDDFTITSIQAKATVQYGWEHFKFYQAVSGGIAMMSGAEKPSFIFDVTYLGLKLDFEQWNVFVDASIPSTGIIKAGASFKF